LNEQSSTKEHTAINLRISQQLRKKPKKLHFLTLWLRKKEVARKIHKTAQVGFLEQNQVLLIFGAFQVCRIKKTLTIV
jgi:hypothetical protein